MSLRLDSPENHPYVMLYYCNANSLPPVTLAEPDVEIMMVHDVSPPRVFNGGVVLSKGAMKQLVDVLDTLDTSYGDDRHHELTGILVEATKIPRCASESLALGHIRKELEKRIQQGTRSAVVTDAIKVLIEHLVEVIELNSVGSLEERLNKTRHFLMFQSFGWEMRDPNYRREPGKPTISLDDLEDYAD